MKRTALLRRTPLKPGKPLQPRTELRRTPINPVSAKRVSDNGERRKVVSAMRLARNGECARCGRRDLPVHGHELIGRAHDSQAFLAPDALLDPICNGWCEDHPRVAAWTGWKVSAKWPHDPALQPFEARRLDGVIVDLRALYAVEHEEVDA